jgi:hypothetical protein
MSLRCSCSPAIACFLSPCPCEYAGSRAFRKNAMFPRSHMLARHHKTVSRLATYVREPSASEMRQRVLRAALTADLKSPEVSHASNHTRAQYTAHASTEVSEALKAKVNAYAIDNKNSNRCRLVNRRESPKLTCEVLTWHATCMPIMCRIDHFRRLLHSNCAH